jgi:arylsulfatase A-like enzyme
MKALTILLSLFTFQSLIFGATKKPNVLLISIDDLNDWVGCMGGHPQAKTPNIDRVAKMGTLFNNAHCQSPVCNPSRASMMTGRYPHTSGVYFLSPDLKEAPVLKNLKTMPEVFADHGYKTMAAGKIYHTRDHRFFQSYKPPVDLGHDPQRRFHNPMDIRYGTGESFRMTTM